MRSVYLLILLLSFGTKAEGFCDEGVVNTIKTAYPKAAKAKNTLQRVMKLGDSKARVASISKYGSQCKVWPAFPDLAIVAAGIVDEESVGKLFDLEIFIVSIKDNKIISHYVDKGVLATDRRDRASIKLDTAYYKLNDSTIAFGVRVSKDGFTNLELYTFKDGIINKVMKNLIVSDFFGETGTTCAGWFTEKKRVVLIEKEQSFGFNNLKVKTTHRDFDKERKVKSDEDSSCFETNNKYKRYSNILKFDGKSYVVPTKPNRLKGY
jgi:hypothetical protein